MDNDPLRLIPSDLQLFLQERVVSPLRRNYSAIAGRSDLETFHRYLSQQVPFGSYSVEVGFGHTPLRYDLLVDSALILGYEQSLTAFNDGLRDLRQEDPLMAGVVESQDMQTVLIHDLVSDRVLQGASTIIYCNPDFRIPVVPQRHLRSSQRLVMIVSPTYSHQIEDYRRFWIEQGYDLADFVHYQNNFPYSRIPEGYNDEHYFTFDYTKRIK